MSASPSFAALEAKIFGHRMTYALGGTGPVVVFLHGNPTSSRLWRDVMPAVSRIATCIAPDLIGMGASDKLPGDDPHRYGFAVHAQYLDGFLERTVPEGPLTLVLHDWGAALGFDWARRHADRVAGLAYMEAIVRPLLWSEWPEASRQLFQALRSSAGERLILDRNVFIENILPGSILRTMSPAELDEYRAPFRNPGEDRRVMLSWPRDLPIDGEPAAVVERVAEYARWLSASPIPKLFVNADPGAILVGEQREFCRRWPNQTEITVRGSHFIQEDSAAEIGLALADWVSALTGNT